MENSLDEGFLRQCRTGWLLVEDDFGGKLTEKEKLKYALQCTGRNPSQKSIDKYWSQNGGSTTFTQFCGIMRREHPPTLEDLVTLFKKIDKNGDGLISANELIKILTKKGEPMNDSEAQAIITEMNLSEDRKLDYMEFCQTVIETTEECLRSARLKVQEKERDIQNLRIERRQKGAGIDRQKGVETERQMTPKEEEEHHKYKKRKESKKKEKMEEQKSEKKNGKEKALPPAVIYPITGGSQHAPDGTEGVDSSPDDDISSDLPTVTPTSIDTMSPLSSVPSTDLPEKAPPLPVNKEVKLSLHKENTSEQGGSKGSKEVEIKPVEEGSDVTSKKETKGSDAVKPIKQSNTENNPASEGSKKQGEGSDDIHSGEEDASEIQEELEGEGPMSEGEEEELGKLSLENGTKGEEPSNGVRQPDHLSSDPPTTTDKPDPLPNKEGYNSLSPRTSAAPKPPKNLETWNSIEGKGCFYVDSSGDSLSIQSHQYALCLSSPSHVWIELSATPPGNPLTDMGLYIFHMNEEEKPTQLITYTQHFINGSKWVCRLDLNGGNYLLLPYTPGCWLQQEEEEEEEEGKQTGDVPLVDEANGKTVLTPSCIEVLKEIFVRHDLDSNDAISRNEFDFFHERTSREMCDDKSWKILEDNFDHNEDGEITLKGFLDLHQMTANDEEEGEPELWNIIQAMGYNKRLKLTKACPFSFEVFTQECDGEIEILPMAPSSTSVDPALCQLAKERGTSGLIKDGGDEVVAYTLVTSHLTTIAIENKLSKKCLVQVDCSQSPEYHCSRDSAIHVLGVEPNTTEIAYHLLAKDHKKPNKIMFVASLIKN